MPTRFLLAGFMGIFLALSVSLSVQAACNDPTQQDCNGQCIPEDCLCILEPWPGMPSMQCPGSVNGPLGPFLFYLNSGVWQWAFRIGVAVAVLNGVYGGLSIAQSNGDSGKIDAGKQRLLWSGLGLLILLLSGTFLEYLNPLGFSNHF